VGSGSGGGVVCEEAEGAPEEKEKESDMLFVGGGSLSVQSKVHYSTLSQKTFALSVNYTFRLHFHNLLLVLWW
jgi:hypothetical protein